MRAIARRHGLEMVTGLLTALPVAVQAIHSVVVGWIPLGDDAVIATRAYDVPTTHTPLLGQYSASSAILGGGPQHSLGPTLYWLLAPAARLLEPRALPATIGIVGVLCVVGAVVLARRRGGIPLMLATALGITLMCASIEPENLVDVWNPSAALLPLMLLPFVTWSVAAGDHKLLPLAVLLATFVVQAHLTYLPAAVCLLGVAVAGLWLGREERPRAAVRRSVLIALALAAVCWSAPLLEQAVHRPGNLVQVAESATAGEPTLGARPGWRAIVHTVGVPPWWLGAPVDSFGRLDDVLEDPPLTAIAGALAILAWLVIATVLALRRRRLDVAAATAQGVALGVGAGLIAAATPSENGLYISVAYTLWWASPAGMFAWIAAGWSAAVLLRLPWPRRLAALRAPAVAAGILAVGVTGVAVAARTGPERLQAAYQPIRDLGPRLAERVGADPVLVETAGRSTGFDFKFDVQAAIAYELTRRGVRVYARDLPLGAWHDARGKRIDRRVLVRDGAADVPAGEEALGRFTLGENTYHPIKAQVRDFVVTVTR